MEKNIPTRRTRKATEMEVAAIKTPGRHSVGDGLILIVSTSGKRSWIARVLDPSKRRRDIGLGPYPEVALKDARRRAGEYRNHSREGADPVAVKRAAARTMLTFKEAAEKFHAEREAGFRSQSLADQWFRTLKRHSFSAIGSLPVDQVDGPSVVRLLKPIWVSHPETSGRVLQRVAAVVAWSAAHGYRTHELPVKSVRMGLPRSRVAVEHHAAVVPDKAPEVMAALKALPEAYSRLALEFAILTAARSGEARGAAWSEIDIAAATWTIPTSRIKMAREHIVPLSPEALSIVKHMAKSRGTSDLVFPSRAETPLSDVALSKSQKQVAPGTTVHGWRSTFRDWAAEQVGLPGEIVEAALAHGNPDRVEAAYRRTNFFKKRVPLMAAWGAYLAGDKAWRTMLEDHKPATVHALKAKAA